MRTSNHTVLKQVFGLIIGICASSAAMLAQQAPVTAKVEIVKRGSRNQAASAVSVADASNVVVWLIPVDEAGRASATTWARRPIPQLVQRHKTFEPHVLVIETGTAVEFPNKDPFFHNVFSLFDGKRFDLGLYEAGATNSAHFDRVGVSFLFCNIHPEMSAVVVSVDTPYFAISNPAGHVEIPNVPDGRYELHFWYERSLPEALKSLTRIVNISAASKELGTIDIPENPNFSAAHSNKYGQEYTPPPAGAYGHP